MENSDLSALGFIKKAEVTKDDTIMTEGAGDKANIQDRVEQIKAQLETTTSDYDREKLSERLAKLQGGVAVIKIGGASEVEVGEIKDRVDDALNATDAALKEGIVVGGGCALLYASRVLENYKNENPDIRVGVDLVRKAIRVPTKSIIQNSGEEGAVVVGRLLQSEGVLKG